MTVFTRVSRRTLSRRIESATGGPSMSAPGSVLPRTVPLSSPKLPQVMIQMLVHQGCPLLRS